MDVPGNVAGTTFNDTTAAKQNGKSQAAGGTATDINQDVKQKLCFRCIFVLDKVPEFLHLVFSSFSEF